MSGFNPTFKTAATWEADDLINIAVDITTEAGMLLGVQVYNPNTVVGFVQIFNTIQDLVILGVTRPSKTIPVPPKGYASIDFFYGLEFPSKGMSCAFTDTPRGSGDLASACFISVDYSN